MSTTGTPQWKWCCITSVQPENKGLWGWIHLCFHKVVEKSPLLQLIHRNITWELLEGNLGLPRQLGDSIWDGWIGLQAPGEANLNKNCSHYDGLPRWRMHVCRARERRLRKRRCFGRAVVAKGRWCVNIYRQDVLWDWFPFPFSPSTLCYFSLPSLLLTKAQLSDKRGSGVMQTKCILVTVLDVENGTPSIINNTSVSYKPYDRFTAPWSNKKPI